MGDPATKHISLPIFYDQWLHAIQDAGVLDLHVIAAELRTVFKKHLADKAILFGNKAFILFGNKTRVPASEVVMIDSLKPLENEVIVYAENLGDGWHVSLTQSIENTSYQAQYDTTYFNAHENGEHMIHHALGSKWRPLPEIIQQGVQGMCASRIFDMPGMAGSGMTIVNIIEDDDEGTNRHRRIVMTRSPMITDKPY